MNKNKICALLPLLSAFFLVSCATQAPIKLVNNFYDKKDRVVGVYLNPMPQPDLFLAGQICLLCLAAASIENSSLTKQVKTLSNEDLSKVTDIVMNTLEKKGIKTKKIEKIDLDKLGSSHQSGVNVADNDFTPLQSQYGISELFLVKFTILGAYRTYSNYVPLSAPSGAVIGLMYMVNLKDNTYEFYEPIDFKIYAQGEWDEPPKFPGLTNAYYQAIELTKEKVAHSL